MNFKNISVSVLIFYLWCCSIAYPINDGTSIIFKGNSNPCRTTEKRLGQCIVLKKCPTLLKYYQERGEGRGHPLSDSTISSLQELQCGFEGRDPMVCCPDLFKDITTRPSKPSTKASPLSTKRPPTTTNGPRHRNVPNQAKIKLLPRHCGQITENRIMGGNETGLYEFPWIVLLGYASTNFPKLIVYRCAGTLINNQYVLTVAHCVTKLNNLALVEVRLGEHDIGTHVDCSKEWGCAPPVVDVVIEKVVVHHKYSTDELRNDIALIRLAKKVKFTVAVRPVCLPLGNEQHRDLVNEKVVVAGWGATENGMASQILLKVRIRVMLRRFCANVYDNMLYVSEKQLCVGGVSGKDACTGDSGGPLMIAGSTLEGNLAYIQHGIVSFGPQDCGAEGQPGVYTRIGHYMSWILNNIQS